MNPVETGKYQGLERLALPAATVVTLAATGYLVHRKNSHPFDGEVLKTASLLPYCADIVSEIMPKHEAIIVGGLPIDAFNDSDSKIDPSSRSIKLAPSFKSSLIRSTNGTVRDHDILVFDRDVAGNFKCLSDAQEVELKKSIMRAARNRSQKNGWPTPEMSVFSFDAHASLFHSATIVDDQGRLFLEQGFVKEPLPAESMQKWNLILDNGTTVNILNPWEQYWRSMVRFSSGMKPKDAEKLESMLEKLRSTDGLSLQEESPLCQAYSRFLTNMLDGNSFRAFKGELFYSPKDWQRVHRLGWLAAARGVMAAGQKSQTVQRVVQGTPKLFNLFVGSK